MKALQVGAGANTRRAIAAAALILLAAIGAGCGGGSASSDTNSDSSARMGGANGPAPAQETESGGSGPDGFDTPLLVPGRAGAVLGVYRPTAPFTITAGEGSAEILPGTQSDLLVYGVEGLVNPVLWVEKGQRVEATLQNDLHENTVIHWHGLIVDAANDGGPLSPDGSLEAVVPGASHDYSYEVLNRGGTYWYHPHPYLLTSEQAYHGLASFYIVDDDDERRLREALDLEFGVTDIPVVIQDKRIDAEGHLVYAPTADEWFEGYLGDTILANLTLRPFLDVATRVYRFRLLNGSTARIYRLAFEGGGERLPFSVIGTDGGLLAAPILANEVFLSPGERVDVLLDLSGATPGDEIFLKSLAFDPRDPKGGGPGGGGGMGPMATAASVPPNGAELHVLRLNVTGEDAYSPPIPETLSTVTPIDTSGATRRRISLTRGVGRNVSWLIEGASYNDDPYRMLFETARDSMETWEITNMMMGMPHPMHIHGYQFQVVGRSWMDRSPWGGLLDEDGLLPTDRGWKDTVLIWPGETVRIAIDFSHPFPGDQEYVFHCHNLEHEEQGMMINYRVK